VRVKRTNGRKPGDFGGGLDENFRDTVKKYIPSSGDLADKLGSPGLYSDSKTQCSPIQQCACNEYQVSQCSKENSFSTGCVPTAPLSGPAQGVLSALSFFDGKSVFYGAFVWARRALLTAENGRFRPGRKNFIGRNPVCQQLTAPTAEEYMVTGDVCAKCDGTVVGGKCTTAGGLLGKRIKQSFTTEAECEQYGYTWQKGDGSDDICSRYPTSQKLLVHVLRTDRQWISNVASKTACDAKNLGNAPDDVGYTYEWVQEKVWDRVIAPVNKCQHTKHLAPWLYAKDSCKVSGVEQIEVGRIAPINVADAKTKQKTDCEKSLCSKPAFLTKAACELPANGGVWATGVWTFGAQSCEHQDAPPPTGGNCALGGVIEAAFNTGDRSCKAIAPCNIATEFVQGWETPTATACGTGGRVDACKDWKTCTALNVCVLGDTFQSKAPETTSQGTQRIQDAGVNEYQCAATATENIANRECTCTLTCHDAAEVALAGGGPATADELTAATLVKDRTCKCKADHFNAAETGTCATKRLYKCTPCTDCKDWEYQVTECSNSKDRTCARRLDVCDRGATAAFMPTDTYSLAAYAGQERARAYVDRFTAPGAAQCVASDSHNLYYDKSSKTTSTWTATYSGVKRDCQSKQICDFRTQVRKTPSWPRSWANFSLF
jgi:hypothetical protein